MSSKSYPTSGEPEVSRFWRQLGEEHAHDLDTFGVEQAKRHQALRYFTWKWRWRGLWRSEQFRFLLRHSSARTLRAAAKAPADLSDAAWTGVPWPRRDRWLYVFAVRLVWEYARRNDPLGVVELAEPQLGNPLPVRWNGRLISQDLANSALEAAAIARALGDRRPQTVLEVGAGYGRLTYAMLNAWPEARATIVDIEPALTISRWYLSQLFPAHRLDFRSPREADDLLDGFADLAVSISSLHEMTPAHVDGYLHMLDRVAAGGVVYLKQWRRWHNPDDAVTLDFERYPVPARWSRIFHERAPVQVRFQQAAWALPVT